MLPQTACLGYLRDLSKIAGPLLRPHIAELIFTAVSGMGDLENSALAHVQVRCGRGVASRQAAVATVTFLLLPP